MKELEAIKYKVSEYYSKYCYQDMSKKDTLELEAFIIDKVNKVQLALTPPMADEILEKYFDNYLGYNWPSTDIKFVKIFYKDEKFYITDDWVNTEEVTIEWVKMTCELFFIAEGEVR